MIECPLCQRRCAGGCTLVRHLHDDHEINYNLANTLVDDLYEKLEMAINSNKKSAGMPPHAPAMLEGCFAVPYEHLTADQCEELKARVKNKEKEYTWGTYGPMRDEELQHYSIDNLSTQHLENILITQPQIRNELAAAILMLLKKRYGVI